MTAETPVTYLWHEAPVPPELPATRVHGYLLCPDTGRVLIQDVDGVMGLPGGRPEPHDTDPAATFVREALEENQVRVGAVAYLGYQEVREPGRTPYAQIRMAGIITAFEPPQPDPDGTGHTCRRLMVPLADAADVLGWGEPALAQAKAAARIAETEWGLPVNGQTPAGYVD
ncbi:NUDIX domain-containing protein [Planomonospora sp. ID82291]|uniref:NUDIX domain-containing protein n=1 Tax=Planomonospora sp. ID82291 TaxID=2738136 RepID=UPI0018C42857|nr:NUDIX domain-containing protein [Planomonospora sp. ID82291]MBG0818457.1 NUDIX domain-containing protein [Planomonospora sp. ID82291]